MSAKKATPIRVKPSKIINSVLLLETASASDPKIGLDMTDTNAPSARKIDVYRWVSSGFVPIRCSRRVGNSGSMNAKRSSSDEQWHLD